MQKDNTSTWTLDQFPVPEKDGETRFHDFDLDLNLMRGIAEQGFQYCTPIQAEVLEHTLLAPMPSVGPKPVPVRPPPS